MKKQLLIIFLGLLFAIPNITSAAGTDDFIITVKTDNTGTSASDQFTIPTTGIGYNYNVDCNNDGTDEATGVTGDYTCDYSALGGAGTYTIRIEDTLALFTGFDRIYFNNGGDKDKLISVDQWGTGTWTSFNSAFEGATNMTISATDTPDLSAVTDLSYMFTNAANMNTNIDSWDVSNITDTQFMFSGAVLFNQSLNSWDMRNVTAMDGMFEGATAFNGDISQWELPSVTSLYEVFYNASSFNQDISTKVGGGNQGGDAWNMSGVLSMRRAFSNATVFNAPIANWDTGNVSDMGSMFQDADAFAQPIGVWDVRNVSNMEFMFRQMNFNEDITAWQTDSLTNTRYMFNLNNGFNQDISTKSGGGNQGGDAWDMSQVTNMSIMFQNAGSFDQDIGNWDTGSVLNMQAMFRNSSFNQDISGWDTGLVSNMVSMFNGTSAFDQNIGGWDVSSLTNAATMFTGSTLSLTNYDALLNGWDAQTLQSGVTFSGGNNKYCLGETARANMIASDSWILTDGGKDCPTEHFVMTVKTDNAGTSASDQFTIPTVGSGYNYNVDCNDDGIDEFTAQTGNVTCDYSSLGGAGTYTVRIKDNSGAGTGFQRIYFNNGGDAQKLISVDQWGTGTWSNFENAFYGASNLTTTATDTPDLTNVTSMHQMFSGAVLATPDTSTWNTTNVTNMEAMFYGASSANPDTSGWNTSNVTTMASMFYDADAANPDTSGWNTSNVTLMSSMFTRTSIANPDTSGWNTSLVTDMGAMFSGASAANPDTSGWNTSNVTDMSSMFRDAPMADPDTSGWDTGSVTNMSSMFREADVANPDTSLWNTSNVTNMSVMFSRAPLANPDVAFKSGLANGGGDAWDVSSVTTMYVMFFRASSANPDVSNWDVSSVSNMSVMFEDALVANPDVTGWNTASLTNTSYMFKGTHSFDRDLSGWDVTNLTNATDMFTTQGLSLDNYDATLIGWNAQALNSGVNFNAGTSTYCAGTTARANMIASDSWSISDGGQDCFPTVVITAPTKLSNGSITDTTIQITDLIGINVAGVSIDGSSTATASALSCTQTDAVTVDCTISVDSSGDLIISATNTSANTDTATESTYVVDTVGPVPMVSIDTVTNGVDMPIFTFTATDNIAVDHFEITYNTDDGLGGSVGASTTDNPVTSPVTLTLDPDETLHSVTIRTYDTAGNFTDTTLLFPPTINFTQPTAISNTTISDTTFIVTSATGNDLENISINANGTGATLGTCTGSDLGTTTPWMSPVTCDISGVTATGTINVSAEDTGNGAVGVNNLSYTIETTNPVAVITAPTKADNVAITDTTIRITDDTAINVADVSISAENTTGTFSVSGLSCTQTTSSQVDCTLQIDANEGTGDLRVTYSDVAGNSTTTDEAGYAIDTTAPGTPSAPDLQAGSDTGSSSTDDYTSDTTPTFDVVCTEATAKINIYIDGVNTETFNCSAAVTLATTLTVLLGDGTYAVTYSEEDQYGNESSESPALSVTIDTASATTTVTAISSDTGISGDQITNDQTLIINGNAGGNDTVEVFIDAASIGTTTANASGAWSFDHTGTTLAAGSYSITAQSTDLAGNVGAISTALPVTIDITAPAAPTPAPDLQAGSDLGTSSTDDITSDTTPSFDVSCTIVGSIIRLYSDNPAANTTIGIHTCTAIATETITVSPAILDGVHNVSYSESDLAGNESVQSATLAVTIDAFGPAAPVLTAISTDSGTSATDQITNDQTLVFSGTAEIASTVEIFLDAVPIGTTTTDGSGDWSFDHTGTTLAPATIGVTLRATDTSSNVGGLSAVSNVVIDLTPPTTPAAAPDLQAASDTGLSSTDDYTNDNTPSFDVVCTEVGEIITLYSDNPAASTAIGTHTCTAVTTETATVSPAIVDGIHNITYSGTDLAGNESGTSSALAVTIDTAGAAAPIAPDLQAVSDSGSSITDDYTSDTTPSFDVACSLVGSTITLYSDNPAASTAIGTHTCTAVTTETATVSPAIAGGVHNVSYTETDLAANESTPSTSLAVTIDVTAPAAPTISTPTNGSPVTGTAENGSTVVVTTPSGSTCTTIAVAGAYSCTLAGTPVDGEDVTAISTDLAGNATPTTATSGIDTSAPTNPTVDVTTSGATTITGTGEIGTTITLGTIICGNAPVIVDGLGIWSCTAAAPAPVTGETITATSTDGIGNFSTGSYTIPNPSSGGGGSSRKKTIEEEEEVVVLPIVATESNPFGGELCPAHLLISNLMRNGDDDGKYSSYNKGVVTQVSLLQWHMNRLLLDEYGNQASGPVDGIFRSKTKLGVERLQTRLNQLLPDMAPLKIDGIVGPFTRDAINNSCGEAQIFTAQPTEALITTPTLSISALIAAINELQAKINSLLN